jgi:hypothetical protein
MQKYGIHCQLRIKLFLIVIYCFSLVKAAMNAPRLCKLCKDCLTNGVHKMPPFLNFPIVKGGTKRPKEGLRRGGVFKA